MASTFSKSCLQTTSMAFIYKPSVTIPAKYINIMSRPVCRVCLSSNRKLFHIKLCAKYFYSFAAIKVEESDGLPQWVCWQCRALLVKANHFKYKMITTNIRLWQIYKRNALAAVDVNDVELNRYPLPELKPFNVTLLDTTMTAGNFIVLKHGNTEITKPTLIKPKMKKIREETNPFTTKDSFLKELENVETAGHMIQPKDPLAEESHTLVMKDSFPKHLLETDKRVTVKGVESESEARGFEKVAVFSHSKKQDESTDTEDEFRGTDTKYEKRDESTDTEDEFRGTDRKYEKRDETTDTVDEFLGTDRKYEKRDEASDEILGIDRKYIRAITLTDEEQKMLLEEKKAKALKYSFPCNLCFVGFDYEVKLQNHMKRHSPSRGKHKCETCQTHYKSPCLYRSHQLIHTTKYKCLACGLTLSNLEALRDHCRVEHERKLLKCDMCDKLFKGLGRLYTHRKWNHKNLEKVKCDLCPKMFSQKYIAEHRLTHMKESRNYKCSTCDKTFCTRTTLTLHERTHRSEEVTDDSYYCAECDVRFKTKGYLQIHLEKTLKHRDPSTWFSCTRCEKLFDTETNLKQHESIQHDGVREFICDICDAALSRKQTLIRHMLYVHRGVKVPRKYLCSECGKAFSTKRLLASHVLIHTGEKPFSCEHCGRAFRQSSAMKTHIRLVHLKVKDNKKVARKPAKASKHKKQKLIKKAATT